jgi:hypothetical protein
LRWVGQLDFDCYCPGLIIFCHRLVNGLMARMFPPGMLHVPAIAHKRPLGRRPDHPDSSAARRCSIASANFLRLALGLRKMPFGVRFSQGSGLGCLVRSWSGMGHCIESG